MNWAKKYVCPIYSCFIEFHSPSELKDHINLEHPELEENDLKMDDNGNLNIK